MFESRPGTHGYDPGSEQGGINICTAQALNETRRPIVIVRLELIHATKKTWGLRSRRAPAPDNR